MRPGARAGLLLAALMFAPLLMGARPGGADADRAQMFREVAQGTRPLASLSPDDQRAFIRAASLLAPQCPADPPVCRTACEAARELAEASDDLAQCARRLDLDEDCSSAFHDVRDAQDDYETAVSDANGECG